MTRFAYTVGRDKHDVHPALRPAGTFDELQDAVLAARHDRDKEHAPYYARPFAANGEGKPRRAKEHAQPCAWLALDVDRLDPEAAPRLDAALAQWRGFWYSTASASADNRKRRVVLACSRVVTLDEHPRVVAAVEHELARVVGAGVEFDHAAAADLARLWYLPTGNAAAGAYHGAPLDVEAALAHRHRDDEPHQHEHAPTGERIAAGGRNAALTREAGRLRRLGLSPAAIAAALAVVNAERCAPPLPADEVDTIARSVGRYEAPADPAPLDILRTVAAPPLRAEDVPPVLARLAQAQADSTGWDVSIMLAAGVGAACAALGDDVRLCVAPASSWFESARLWVAIVAGPGAGKSPGSKAMLAPIFAMHREAFAQWQAEHKDDDEAPPPPALYTSDATTEALAESLRGNERGLLYFVDELESWLASHDAYRAGAGKDRGEWLRLYDGGPHQVHRIRRGAFFVRNWGCSLLSATTPAALRKLAPKLPDDGLLQRLLLVLARPSELSAGTAMRAPAAVAAAAWEDCLRRLYAQPPAIVRLSGTAREIFEHERGELHQLTQAYEDVHPPLASHYAKRATMLARLALVFHAMTEGGIGADVSGDTMDAAARFLRCQERHATAIYSTMLGADTGMALARDIARAILASRLESFNRRVITPRCKAFRNADEPARHAALTLLADCGWLARDSLTGGHGAHWTVDPRVHDLFAEHGAAARQRREVVRARVRRDDE